MKEIQLVLIGLIAMTLSVIFFYLTDLVLADIRTPPIVTTNFLYIRFIGDRTIQEKDFS